MYGCEGMTTKLDGRWGKGARTRSQSLLLFLQSLGMIEPDNYFSPALALFYPARMTEKLKMSTETSVLTQRTIQEMSMTLIELQDDALVAVCCLLEQDDMFAASLSCTALRNVLRE